MKHIVFLIVLLYNAFVWSQENSMITELPSVSINELLTENDSSYDGSLDDLYLSIYNNFSFNNISEKDIPEKAKGKSFFMFYVQFAISEDGKPFEFSGHEIAENNPLYVEAVRVMSSTKWNVAIENGEYKKQFIVIPIKVSTSDLK